MYIRAKKIVELTGEEKNTLMAAARILDSLAEELDEGDFFRASEDFMWAVQNSPFQITSDEWVDLCPLTII